MRTHMRERNIYLALCVACALIAVSCSSGKASPQQEAPPPTTVEPELDANNFTVDHPERFPLYTAVAFLAKPALNVTGVVQPPMICEQALPTVVVVGAPPEIVAAAEYFRLGAFQE